MPIGSVRRLPDDENPRRGDVPAMKESLRENTQYRPVVVNRREGTRYGDGTILAGNHTHQALEELGAKEIAVTFVDVDDEAAWKIVLTDNRQGDRGAYDPALIVAAVERAGGIAGTGYDEDFLAGLMGDRTEEGLTDSDEIPEVSAEPISSCGDLWILGEHRLLCGDATDREDLARLMGEELASMLWTDPPYGVSYVGKTKEALTIAGDGQEEAVALLADALAAADKVLRPGSPFYVAHPAGALSVAFGTVVLELGWRLRQGLVWVKDSMVVGHADYHYKHEPILYGYKPGEGRFGRGGNGWYGGHSETSVLEVPRPTTSRDHPTAKPVRLVERCLLNSSRRGALVYEPFGGSGTTLIAAHRTGRRCWAVEIEPRYVDVICRRYQLLTDTLPVLEATGEPHDFNTNTEAA